MKDSSATPKCPRDKDVVRPEREALPGIVDELVHSCTRSDCFDHIAYERIPSRTAVIDLLERMRRLLFPGYFADAYIDRIKASYYFGQETTALYDALADQIALAIRHDCLRHEQDCSHCEDRGHEATLDLLGHLPELRALLATDVRAAFEGDPAAKSHDEIIFSYPGLLAITIYRIAHRLFHLNIPMIPRIMTEFAHSRTGIDIHPGAHIGESFFIDHGTGVVIGETTEIGNRVRLYQGVTLGALSLSREECAALRNKKRHPTIEDDVIVYANATILGGETIIGARSVIGGNVWLTESVPPDTKVFLKKPELVFDRNR